MKEARSASKRKNLVIIPYPMFNIDELERKILNNILLDFQTVLLFFMRITSNL